PKKAAEIWFSLLKEGTFAKNHLPNMQIDLINSLIVNLFSLKNDLANDLANKLIVHLISFKLQDSQKSKLLLIIENNIRNFSKQGLNASFHELKYKWGSQFTEESKLNLRKAYLETSIARENYDLAIEILTLLQKQADEGYVKNAFETLIDKLFQFNNVNNIDDSRLKKCFRLLKDIELKCLHLVRYDCGLQWLSAVNINSGAFNDERVYLLKMALHELEKGSLAEDEIIKISGHLLKYLKAIEITAQGIPNEFKNLIISCHPLIAQKLQNDTCVEKFYEYLTALNHLQISLKISNIVLSQSIWITAAYLKKYLNDSNKLQDVHKLLIASLHPSTSIKIDRNITADLASALLSHKLPHLAMKWISYLLTETASITSSELDLSLPLTEWSKSFIEQNELQLCLTTLKALKDLKCQPAASAELYMNVSRAFLEKDIALSVQLLLDNWDLIQTNCISKDDFEEFIKEVIRKIFSTHQEIDVLSLFSALMINYKTKELSFLLEQFKNSCDYVEAHLKGLNVKKLSVSPYEFIESTFFKTLTQVPLPVAIVYKCILIQILLECQERELVSSGIIQLNILLDEVLSLDIIPNQQGFLLMTRNAIKNWFLILKDSQMTSSELIEMEGLLLHYSILIDLKFADNIPELEKEMTILLLQISLYHSTERVVKTIEVFMLRVNKYGNDSEWMEKCTSIIIDSIMKVSIKSKNYLNFLNWFREVELCVREINPNLHKTFLI
ncbi:MAG: hypothetical protein H0U49_02980, partial [Parachlamydiaceae bacterium]|nr:hypothetical protein [Parachlamydiaceae bacterium]